MVVVVSEVVVVPKMRNVGLVRRVLSKGLGRVEAGVETAPMEVCRIKGVGMKWNEVVGVARHMSRGDVTGPCAGGGPSGGPSGGGMEGDDGCSSRRSYGMEDGKKRLFAVDSKEVGGGRKKDVHTQTDTQRERETETESLFFSLFFSLLLLCMCVYIYTNESLHIHNNKGMWWVGVEYKSLDVSCKTTRMVGIGSDCWTMGTATSSLVVCTRTGRF